MDKTIRLGTIDTGRKQPSDVYCHIKHEGGRLSITGVVGPTMGGDAHGNCGQIVDSLADVSPACGKWTKTAIKRFAATWRRWHLNDMRAGSPVQEEWLRSNPIDRKDYAHPKSHYEVASCRLAEADLNPDPDGYKYGHAWKSEEVPASVLSYLSRLPDTDKTPAWV